MARSLLLVVTVLSLLACGCMSGTRVKLALQAALPT
jgi:hypothetical protein